jgi:putative PIN family toxin of toxin-antitoxin system
MSMPIVVDTSVLISAFIGSQGPGREVLRRCLRGEYRPLISNALFHEYEDVIARAEIIERCPLSIDEIRALLNAFYAVCQWLPIYFLWRPNLKDEGDNFLVELAIACHATAIVTNNLRDLKHAELKFPDLSVLSPEQLLRGPSRWQH